MDDHVDNGGETRQATLAESLAIMTRRPRGPLASHIPSATHEMAPLPTRTDATDPALHTEMSIMEDKLLSDTEQYTPASGEFTAEMAQAILNSEAASPAETAAFPMPSSPDGATDGHNADNKSLTGAYPSAADESETAGSSLSYNQDYAERAPAPALQEMPDMLAGFDPSKYLAGAPGAAPTAPAQEASHEANSTENQEGSAPGAVDSSTYDDVEHGTGVGGQKDSREAMQMLRELSVLRESY